MQKVSHIYNQYYDLLEPVLTSKAEELFLLGYGEVSTKDLWNYFTKKKWKKTNEDIHLYELVSDVLSLKAGEYMNFATVEAYRSPNWFVDLNEDELQELLKPKRKNNRL